MNVYKSISEIIGNTPLLELVNIKDECKFNANIYAKLEYLNPAGSVKDRVAKQMIDDAEAKGLLKPGSTIIEPTSGNTGIGLASIGASRGYRVIIIMPDSMSKERISTIEAYGAEVYLTEGRQGMKATIEMATELSRSIENSFMPMQFENPSNPKIHRETTAVEIYNDLEGKVDCFIAGVGTGGTITGVGEYLKSKNKDIKIIAVEPEMSPVLSKGTPGKHGIQGIGAGFVPKVLNKKIYDEIITVSDEDAYKYGRLLGKREGILCGISSGAALCAAVGVAQRKEFEGKNIVVLLPDSGDRYLSTKLFEN